MFEKIKKFYDMGLYTPAQVWAFVVRGKLTAEEYRDIVEGENAR